MEKVPETDNEIIEWEEENNQQICIEMDSTKIQRLIDNHLPLR